VAIAKDVVADVHAATSGAAAAAAAVADKSTASSTSQNGPYFYAGVVAAMLLVVGMSILYQRARVKRHYQPNSQFHPLSTMELLRRKYFNKYSGRPTREERNFIARAGTTYDATVTFVNDGNVPWPTGTHLARFASTADLTQTQLLDTGKSHFRGVQRVVRPNESVTFPLHINVPPNRTSNPATETLRLYDTDVRWFGEPVVLNMTASAT
jgi:predicted heme/steroid binding protein